MIHYLFGISVLTPAKIAWIAITLTNVGMMLWLGVRKNPYFFIAAICSLIQGAHWWRIEGEAILAGAAFGWTLSLLPKDKWGRIFVLSIGVLIGAILAMALPRPWPMYSVPMYYTRLYSCAMFSAICFAIAILPWTDRYRFNWNAGIAACWFATTVFQAVITNWYYWTHQLVAVILYSLCLTAWIYGPRFARSAPGDSRKHATVLLPRSLL
jgi:hypothetical protein